MGNLFDNLQKTVFKKVQKTMGYPATWQPSAGGLTVSATVLFKDATKRAKLLNADYEPNKVLIEFQQGDFDALVELVRNTNAEEIVVVNGVQYGVLQITSVYDGKSYYAELEDLS